MLETIREYAVECLDTSDQAETPRRRHAEHYLELGQASGLAYESERRRNGNDLIRPEEANTRAALGWSVDADPLLGIRLAVSVEYWWYEELRGRIGQWEGENTEVASLVLAGEGPEFERGRPEGRRLSLREAVAAALS
jgi:hypothetical protein